MLAMSDKMTENTKVRINLNEGIIELEGSEEFVSKYLDEYKNKIFKESSHFDKPSEDMINQRKSNLINKERIKTDQTDGNRKKFPKKVEIEAFDTKGNQSKGIPTLQSFVEEKKPTVSSFDRITVFGYYITNILKQDEFSEGNIEFAYKVLGLSGRPKHLHQAFLDTKCRKGWVEQGNTANHWTISRLGVIEIEDKMPRKEGD